MEIETLYDKHRHRLKDFWGRRDNKPRFTREFRAFGHMIQLASNHEGVLRTADFCQPLYSTAPPVSGPSFSIQFVVQTGPADPGPVPANLFDHIQYTGEADWLMLQLGLWGHAFVDLATGHATAVLSPQLAQVPETVCLCLLNTVITNYFIAHGYGMLHASCLFRDSRALLLMAPHNTGKSTAALQLALAGSPLLSDSMVFLPPHGEELRLLGFPVGKVKVRPDMLSEFPHLQPLFERKPVREETKYTLDLRELEPALIHAEVAKPDAVDLCLLERSGSDSTHLAPAAEHEAMAAIMVNSLYYDTAAVWQRNLAAIQRLFEKARLHRLRVGPDDGLVEVVTSLWNEYA